MPPLAAFRVMTPLLKMDDSSRLKHTEHIIFTHGLPARHSFPYPIPTCSRSGRVRRTGPSPSSSTLHAHVRRVWSSSTRRISCCRAPRRAPARMRTRTSPTNSRSYQDVDALAKQGVVLIAATNHIDQIDRAVLDRLGEHIRELSPLTTEQRAVLLKRMLPERHRLTDDDVIALVEHVTGGSVRLLQGLRRTIAGPSSTALAAMTGARCHPRASM